MWDPERHKQKTSLSSSRYADKTDSLASLSPSIPISHHLVSALLVNVHFFWLIKIHQRMLHFQQCPASIVHLGFVCAMAG